MIRRARLKIIITLSALFFASIFCIEALVFVYVRRGNRNDINSLITNHFRVLAENRDVDESKILEGPPKVHPEGDDYSVDRQRQEIYSVRSSSEIDGEFEIFEKAEGGSLSEDEIISLADEIFSLSKLSGTYKNYVFASTMVNDELVISFVDITETINKEYRNLAAMTLLDMAFWLLLTLGSVPVSSIMVKPLEEAIRRQAEFISMAEHELKTPIAVMKTSLTMLEKEGVKSKYLGYATEENEKMKKLVAELLELSRAQQLEKSDMKVFGAPENMKRTDFSSCIEGAVLPFESVAFEKGVNMTIDVEPEIYAEGDEAQIERLAGILVDNAIKHTDKGKVVLISLAHEGENRCIFKVSNEGEEIPKGERSRIFEPFYRIDKARNRDEGRYGLGLSIADSIAKAHGTSISVDYIDGKTVFSIYFSVI